jgi:hypothetical protein
MWPFSKRRAQPARGASAVPAARSDAAVVAAPVCAVCGRALERRVPPAGSMLRPLFVGVVCRTCGWIECRACKGSPSDAPCPVCASAVMPAYCALFEPHA